MAIRDPRPQAIRQVPLFFHVLSFATLMCACRAVNEEINSGLFLYGTAALALAGHSFSVYLRSKQRPSRTIDVLVFGMCLIVYLRVMLTPYEFSSLRWTGADSPQVKFAQLLISIECLRSFTISSNEAAMFTGVTCIASLGLVATDTGAPGIMTYFMFYMLFVVGMLTRYTFAPKAQPKAQPISSILGQVRLPVLVTALVMIVGALLAQPLRLAGGAAMGKIIPRISGATPGVRVPPFRVSDSAVPIMQGAAYLSDKEMFTVKCDRPAYWRGSAYSTYTGSVWEQDLRPRMRSAFAGPQPHRVTNGLEQVFTLARDFNTVELYGAAEPISMTRLTNSHTRFFKDRENCWTSGSIQSGGFRYLVVSKQPQDSPSRLAKAGANYPREIALRYLQTSLSPTHRVRDLALKVTRDCSNPYEKALALESYLSRNYVYDINPPRPPRGNDVVEFFLFDSQRGYCTAFASAMVIMLRELGIPARFVTGFATGERDSKGVYHVLERDGHAWVEAYFPNCGWVTFDPSGDDDERQQGFWSVVVSETRKSIRNLLGVQGLAPLAVLLVLALAALARPDIARKSIRLSRVGATDPRRRAIQRRYEAVCRIAARSGCERKAAQTPSEYADLLRGSGLPEDASNLIEQATRDFESVKYGGREPDAVLLQNMRTNLRALKSHLPWYRRNRY
jgi:transglutaminase-like putative cysteine protease